MKIKLTLAAIACVFTLSSARAGIPQHVVQIPGGLPGMVAFVGTSAPMFAYPMPDNPKLVRFAWEKTDGTANTDGTYDDYFYCNSTKPNQPVEEMQCEANLDKRGPTYKLFQNLPGKDR